MQVLSTISRTFRKNNVILVSQDCYPLQDSDRVDEIYDSIKERKKGDEKEKNEKEKEKLRKKMEVI
jgi:Zn-finger protein